MQPLLGVNLPKRSNFCKQLREMGSKAGLCCWHRDPLNNPGSKGPSKAPAQPPASSKDQQWDQIPVLRAWAWWVLKISKGETDEPVWTTCSTGWVAKGCRSFLPAGQNDFSLLVTCPWLSAGGPRCPQSPVMSLLSMQALGWWHTEATQAGAAGNAEPFWWHTKASKSNNFHLYLQSAGLFSCPFPVVTEISPAQHTQSTQGVFCRLEFEWENTDILHLNLLQLPKQMIFHLTPMKVFAINCVRMF